MGRQPAQSKKREEEENDRDDEDEDAEDEHDEEDEDEEESAALKSTDPDDDEEEEDDEEGDDLDSALAGGNGRESIYIEPWRKKGKTCNWLHTKTKFKKFNRHKWFDVVQFTKRKTGEEVSFIRFVNWNCHEMSDYRGGRDRDDDLRREHLANICPMDKMIEWVENEIFAGRIKPEDVIFRFDDGNPEHLVELHAAGLTGIISLENCPEKWKRQCKSAKVLQEKQKPWNENLNPKSVHCFQVVDDANPNEVKWAVEPPDLYFKLITAINDEKERSGVDDGDPLINPYPLLWKFDENVAYGQGNKVITQTKRKPSNKILRLIKGPKRKDQKDVIGPGDCTWLRASMENHIVDGIEMPFDEIFAAAKRAGLMKGSAIESKSSKTSAKRKDDGDEESNSDPKPKVSSKTVSEVAPTVGTCDICHGEVGDEDVECATCGATFDPDNEYRIDGVKCIECGTLVPLFDASEEDGDLKAICPKCGSIHRLSPSVDRFYGELADEARKGKVKFAWTAETKPEPKKESTPKREGRTGRGKSSESKALDKKLDGQKIPF